MSSPAAGSVRLPDAEDSVVPVLRGAPAVPAGAPRSVCGLLHTPVPGRTAGAVPVYSRSRVSPPLSDTQYRDLRRIAGAFDHSNTL